jgi:hypothetical protein
VALLYSSFSLSLIAAVASVPSSALPVSGRPTRSSCPNSEDVVAQMPSSGPCLATRSMAIDTTSDAGVHPSRKSLAAPPSVCRHSDRIASVVFASKVGQPAASVAAALRTAAAASWYAARVPFTLLKNGSSRLPANTRSSAPPSARQSAD